MTCGQTLAAGYKAEKSVGRGFRHTQWDRDHGLCVAPVAAAPVTDAATARQVAYVLDLQATYWTPAVFGGDRYDRSQLEAMSRAQISRVIDTLLTERGCQVGY